MDGVIFTHGLAIIFCFICFSIFAGTSFDPETNATTFAWTWKGTLVTIIIAALVLHAVTIGVVQSKFTLTKPSGYQFANIVIKDDGSIVELTKPALWGKGQIVKIKWKDGYKYEKDSGCYREKSIMLSYVLINKIENVIISIPLCINIKLTGYINSIELFKILLNNQPNAITAGENLSVDRYFKSIIDNIAAANHELITNLCKEYLDSEITESVLMNKLTKEISLGDIIFPSSEVTGYSIGQPEVSARPKL